MRRVPFLITLFVLVHTERNFKECGISCETKPCPSRFSLCVDDDVCGKICISKGHVCNDPEKIENGKIIGYYRRSYGAKINYTCDDNYELIGSRDRICMGNKEWSGKTPRCVKKGIRCPKPPFVVANGYADIDDEREKFYVGEKAVYKCHIGFVPTSSTNTETTCDYTSDGSADWTPEIKLKCQEKTCNEPESIPNGAYMKSSSYHVGHQINYSCIEGYVLQGTGIRTCSDNQQWSGSLPSCEVFVETCSCDFFTKDVNETSLRIKGKCTELVTDQEHIPLECEEGYSLMQGPNEAICLGGKWKLLGRSRCQKMCSCDLLKQALLSSVRLKENCNDRIDDGKVIRMECKEGYSSNRKERSAVCDNGEWIMPFKLVCKDLTEINDPLTQPITTEDCDPFATNCFEDIECLFEKPDYVRVTLNGKLQKDTSFNVADGAVLIMRCENITQYYFSGDNKLKCNKGQWNGTIPSCTRLRERERFGIPVIKYQVGKSEAIIDIDGSLQVTTGEILKLSCLYFKSYSKIAKWSYRNLVDSQISFKPEWNINQNAYEINLSPVKKYHETEYTCCMNEKLCNSIRIKVIELQCEEPPLPVNGFIRGSVSLSIDSEIEYACDRKYLLEGGTKSKCILLQGSLKWSHPPPRCNEKLCENPTVPENGFIRKVTHKGINGTVNFGCHRGYDLVGEETATCNWVLNKIQWSKDPPKCVKISGNPCSELNKRNGLIRYNSEKEGICPYRPYKHRSTATVICREGHEISPVKELITSTILVECSDGKWLPEVTCIEARCSCKEIPREMKERKLKFKNCNTNVDSGTYNLSIECQEGFRAAMREQLAHCERGIWTISRLTRQTECEQVSDKCRLDLSNANNLIATYTNISFTGSLYDFDEGSVIKFRCDELNKLEGNKKTSCHNGRWISEIPKCIPPSVYNPELPPLVDFRIGDNRIRTFTDDGRIVLPKNHLVDIYCWSNSNRRLTVETDRVSGKFIKVQNELHYSHTTTTTISSEQTAEATVNCSTAGNFHIFDIVFSDICLLCENDLNQRGFRVVPKSKQVIYVEGDEIEIESTSTPYSKKQLKCMGSSNNSGIFVSV